MCGANGWSDELMNIGIEDRTQLIAKIHGDDQLSLLSNCACKQIQLLSKPLTFLPEIIHGELTPTYQNDRCGTFKPSHSLSSIIYCNSLATLFCLKQSSYMNSTNWGNLGLPENLISQHSHHTQPIEKHSPRLRTELRPCTWLASWASRHCCAAH